MTMSIVVRSSSIIGHEKKIRFSNVEIVIELGKSGFCGEMGLT